MGLKLSNNANGILALAISDNATSLTLRAGHGSRFPVLGPGDWFPITVVRASDPSQLEIMRCTARSGDTLTVVRAQEGTSAITFDAGDVVSLRLTSGTLEENFPQVEGRNAKGLRFSIDSDGRGLPELTFSGSGGSSKVVPNKGGLGSLNLDEAVETGVYTQPSNATHPDKNYPNPQYSGGLLVFQARNDTGNLRVVQLYAEAPHSGGLHMRKHFSPDGWSPWRRFAFADEIGELKGKRMLFLEATAPPGWTQDTSINDRVLRIVNSAGGGLGGSWTITGMSVSVNVHGHTLTEAQLPPHRHDSGATLRGDGNAPAPAPFGKAAIVGSGSPTWEHGKHYPDQFRPWTSTVGGGQAHSHGASASVSHSGSWRPAYVDVIACTKD